MAAHEPMSAVPSPPPSRRLSGCGHASSPRRLARQVSSRQQCDFEFVPVAASRLALFGTRSSSTRRGIAGSPAGSPRGGPRPLSTWAADPAQSLDPWAGLPPGLARAAVAVSAAAARAAPLGAGSGFGAGAGASPWALGSPHLTKAARRQHGQSGYSARHPRPATAPISRSPAVATARPATAAAARPLAVAAAAMDAELAESWGRLETRPGRPLQKNEPLGPPDPPVGDRRVGPQVQSRRLRWSELSSGSGGRSTWQSRSALGRNRFKSPTAISMAVIRQVEAQRHQAAIRLQAAARGRARQSQFQIWQKAGNRVTTAARRKLARRAVASRRRHIVLCQAYGRGWLARRDFGPILKMVADARTAEAAAGVHHRQQSLAVVVIQNQARRFLSLLHEKRKQKQVAVIEEKQATSHRQVRRRLRRLSVKVMAIATAFELTTTADNPSKDSEHGSSEHGSDDSPLSQTTANQTTATMKASEVRELARQKKAAVEAEAREIRKFGKVIRNSTGNYSIRNSTGSEPSGPSWSRPTADY